MTLADDKRNLEIELEKDGEDVVRQKLVDVVYGDSGFRRAYAVAFLEKKEREREAEHRQGEADRGDRMTDWTMAVAVFTGLTALFAFIALLWNIFG